MIAEICMIILTLCIAVLVVAAVHIEVQVWREAKEWEQRRGKEG